MTDLSNTLDYSIFSKRRDDLFGISIVSIVIFHFFLSCQKAGVYVTYAVTYNALIGRVGVPVFLVLSGMGLFFSMSRNGDLKQFYRKRFTRLLIPYIIIASAHFILRYFILEQKGFIAFLKGFFFVEFFEKGITQFWFIAILILLYAVFPLLFRLFRSGKYAFLKLAVLIGLCLGFNVLLNIFAPDLYKNISIMLTLIPAFLIGVYCGEKAYHQKAIRWQFWFITLAVSAVYLVFSIRKEVLGIAVPSSMLHSFAETIWALLLMSVIAIVLEAIQSAAFSKLCAFFGAMSLELYMVHVSLRALMHVAGLSPAQPLYYGAMVAVAIGLCFLLQKFDAFATKKLTVTKQIEK